MSAVETLIRQEELVKSAESRQTGVAGLNKLPAETRILLSEKIMLPALFGVSCTTACPPLKFKLDWLNAPPPEVMAIWPVTLPGNKEEQSSLIQAFIVKLTGCPTVPVVTCSTLYLVEKSGSKTESPALL